MVRRDPPDRREAEAWTVTKAPTDREDPRGKQVTRDPQDRPPTPLTLRWQKVPEETRDSQDPMGIQEVVVNRGIPAPQGPQGCLSEMKMR